MAVKREFLATVFVFFLFALLSVDSITEQQQHEHNGILTPYRGEPPQIELNEREIKKRLHHLHRNRGSLASILLNSTLPEIELSIEDELATYQKHLMKVLSLSENDIFDFKEDYFLFSPSKTG